MKRNERIGERGREEKGYINICVRTPHYHFHCTTYPVTPLTHHQFSSLYIYRYMMRRRMFPPFPKYYRFFLSSSPLLLSLSPVEIGCQHKGMVNVCMSSTNTKCQVSTTTTPLSVPSISAKSHHVLPPACQLPAERS